MCEGFLTPPLADRKAILRSSQGKPDDVGRQVFDLFGQRAALRHAQGVVITGVCETSATRTGWSVPKGELISKLQALLHAGDLRIAAGLPDAAVLARELQDFRVRFTDNGNATFSTREGAYDDLVLALALAVFGLSRSEPAESLQVAWGARRSPDLKE